MKIKINGVDLKNYVIKNFNMTSSFNKHTLVNLELELLDINQINGKSIELSDKTNFFSGEVYHKLISKYAIDGKKAIIKAYSYSKIMDIKKNFRVFQDENITYYDIANEILKNYKFKYMISDLLKVNTNRMYIQYDETDYMFLTRILYDIKEYIYTTYNGVIMIGVQNVSKADLKNIEIIGNKDNNSYYRVKDEIYVVGDSYKEENVCNLELTLYKNIYLLDLELCKKEKYKFEPKRNIKGTFIEASVVEVVENKEIACMKVDFSKSIEDKSKNKKTLSFATPYSKFNTGFFPTPEIGDTVDVYFPSNNENEAKVAFCINNKGSNKFCNDKLRRFNCKNVMIELSDETLTLNLSKFNVYTNNEINFASNSVITQEAKYGFSIYGNEIKLISKKGNIDINSEGNVNVKGKKIYNN